MQTPHDSPLNALNRVLESLGSVRNGKALFALLGSFASAGLLLAMAEASLARGAEAWGSVQAVAAFVVAFYGGNATGFLVMDDAAGRPTRELADALRASLRCAHRLLLVFAAVLLLAAGVLAALTGLLWLCRLPSVGPLLFTVVVPVAVITLGLMAVAGVAVVGPLAAPAVWSGLDTLATVRLLIDHVRRRLLYAALLTSSVSLLAGAVGAVVTFAVVAGGRAVAALAVAVIGVDLPPQQLMAGLFGHGLRTLGAAGAPVTQNAHGMAALVGGGVVFALALVLPGVVYLRGMCSVHLALHGTPPR